MYNLKHLILLLSCVGSAAIADEPQAALSVELNAQAISDAGCLLTFMVSNGHAQDVEAAVFETVLFNKAGEVDRLTLFDFGSLPAGRPRVRQFQVEGLACEELGQVLINGASTCRIAGADSAVCGKSLKLNTRTDTELTG